MELHCADSSLYDFALRHKAMYDARIVWVDVLSEDVEWRDFVRLYRQRAQNFGVSYQVVYGDAHAFENAVVQQVEHYRARTACVPDAEVQKNTEAVEPQSSYARWLCECCLDPESERALFKAVTEKAKQTDTKQIPAKHKEMAHVA